MTTMNALSSPSIRHAEFVKISIGPLATPTATYYYCNAGGPITVDGKTFTDLGSLMSVGDVQRDIKATSDDMAISLTGLNPNNVSLILSANIKGSIVEIWRGFLDSNNQVITTPTLQFFKRYQGIISNVSITENYNEQARIRVATCSISCSSMRRVLENRISGVKTNVVSWQSFYANDTSMSRVAAIQSTYFDFGAPPKVQTQTSDTSQVDTTGTSNGGW